MNSRLPRDVRRPLPLPPAWRWWAKEAAESILRVSRAVLRAPGSSPPVAASFPAPEEHGAGVRVSRGARKRGCPKGGWRAMRASPPARGGGEAGELGPRRRARGNRGALCARERGLGAGKEGPRAALMWRQLQRGRPSRAGLRPRRAVRESGGLFEVGLQAGAPRAGTRGA